MESSAFVTFKKVGMSLKLHKVKLEIEEGGELLFTKA
jgi:hypothetical protein